MAPGTESLWKRIFFCLERVRRAGGYYINRLRNARAKDSSNFFQEKFFLGKTELVWGKKCQGRGKGRLDIVPLDSDVSWPLNESGKISLVLNISTNSEVLLLLLEKVRRKGLLVSSVGWSSDYSLNFGELLNLY